MDIDIDIEMDDIISAIVARLEEMTLQELMQTDMFTESLIA